MVSDPNLRVPLRAARIGGFGVGCFAAGYHWHDGWVVVLQSLGGVLLGAVLGVPLLWAFWTGCDALAAYLERRRDPIGYAMVQVAEASTQRGNCVASSHCASCPAHLDGPCPNGGWPQ